MKFLLLFLLLPIAVYPQCINSDKFNPEDTITQYTTPPLPELLKKLNYPHEVHYIITEDKYVLTFFRIQAKDQKWIKDGLPVVYIQHGFIDSSDTFVLNNEPNALGLRLAREGYDVWLGNTRGNKYSLGHLDLKPEDRAFWDYSWQEMSEKDLPAAFEHIYQETGQKINYIGHSQGTTIMFAALSEKNPTVLKYIRTFTALAPIAWMSDINSGPLAMMGKYIIPGIVEAFHPKRFFPANILENSFVKNLCKFTKPICMEILRFTLGLDPEYDDYLQSDLILEHEPGGTSFKNILHWRQKVLNKEFAKFDYGKEENRRRYGQATAPQYDLSNIRMPVNLLFGEDDQLFDKKDIQKIIDNLTGSSGVQYKEYKAGHMSFFWGKDLTFYYDDLLAILKGDDIKDALLLVNY